MPAPAETAAQEEQQPVQEEEPPEAMRLGGEVFGRLGESAKALAAADKLGDVAAWRAAIEARLADEELINIDARIYFEAFVASMLADGWRPGHEALFVAAKDAFAWDGDRRRLWQLGQSGRFLDQAIEERHVFDALPGADQVRMRELAKMLRSEGLPARREILKSMREAERMLMRFPALMSIVTSMGNMERWRSIYHEAGGKPIDLGAEESPPPVKEPKSGYSWQGALIAVALFAVLRLMFNSFGGAPDPLPAARFPRLEEAAIPFMDASVLDKVAPPADYRRPDHERGQLDVVFKVFLNADLQVERVENRRLSGDPDLDRAARAALLSARPFPPNTPRVFLARYVAIAGLHGWLDLGQGKPEVTDKLIRGHLGPVAFEPIDLTPAGNYIVECALTIDAAGVVVDARIVTSSGIPDLDQAVLDMARKSVPFPPGTPSFTFTHYRRIGPDKAVPGGGPPP